MESGKWEPYTNLIYFSARSDTAASLNELLAFSSADSILTAEDDLKASTIKRLEFKVKLRGRQAVIERGQKTFLLEAASVAQICQKTALFVLDVPSCYSEFMQPTSKTPHVRAVTDNEIKALTKAHCCLSPEPELFFEIFPDVCLSEGKLKYGYVVISDSVALRTGSYAKHWLLQLKQLPSRPLSASNLPRSDFCKWGGCLTVLRSEGLLDRHTEDSATRQSASVNRSLVRKGKKLGESAKKTLAPLRKKRSEAESSWQLCPYHSKIKKAAKTASLSWPEDELWRCVQARINWQKELSSKSLFGLLASGEAKQILGKYFKKGKRYLARVVPANTAMSQIKPIQSQDIAEQDDELVELREEKQLEVLATHELRLIAQVEVPGSFLRHQLGPALAQALFQPVSTKLEIVRTMRQRLERMAAGGASHSFSDLWDSASVKQSSRPNTSSKHSDSGKSDNRKRKDEVQRKMHTSPYFEGQMKPVSRQSTKLTQPRLMIGAVRPRPKLQSDQFVDNSQL
jgi:hypothetical protein